MTESKTEFLIFQLSNYKNEKPFFKYNQFNDKHFRGTIDKIIDELQHDKGYHILLRADQKCKFYIDLDKTTEPKFNEFCSILCSLLNIDRTKISYTFSTNEKGASYHLIIPSIITTPFNIKCFFQYYNETFSSFRRKGLEELDLSIYPQEEDKIFTLRLPNQTNTIKNNKHVVINGSMYDFIIEYIETDPYLFNIIELDDYILKNEEIVKLNKSINTKKEEIKPKPNPKPNLSIIVDDLEEKEENNEEEDEDEFNKKLEDINKCLDCIKRDNDIGYMDWFKVGTIIKNETQDINIWIDWSKQGPKYKENTNNMMLTKWRSMRDDKLNIIHLKAMAKDYNKVLYDSYFKVVKVVNPDFIDEEGSEEYIDELNDDKFLKIAKQFEKRHCFIVNKSFYLKQTSNDIIFFSESKITQSYKHIICSDRKDIKTGKKQLFIKNWIEGNKNKRRYEDCNFYPHPLKCPKHIFNMWLPFEMEKYKKDYIKNEEALKFILNHIKILCNHEDDIFEYFIKWIGQMLQYPATKTIIPVLISNEGAGKGTLIQLMRKMLGNKRVFESSDPKRDVFGSFNNLMASAYFVVLNEVGQQDLEVGKFKQLITDGSLVINNKGISAIDTTSYHRFIITTNKEEPVSTKKGDRRNLVIRSSDELCGKKEYFSKMYELLDDINVIRTVYDYLMSIPNLDKFGLIKLPTTEYQRDLQELSISPIEQCIINLIQDNTIQNIDNIIKISSNELFSYFNAYLTSQKIEYNINSLKFNVRLKHLNIKGVDTLKCRTCNYKTIDIVKVKEHFNIIDNDVDFIEGDNEIVV
jgi:hypothetical protein